MSESETIIIDNGSDTCKADFGTNVFPRFTFPTVVGHPRRRPNGSLNLFYIGHQTNFDSYLFDLRCPIENGIVTDWNDMERVWNYIFHIKLRINTRNHPVFLTDAPLNPPENRERTAEIMFEKFEVPAFFIGSQAVLSLFSSGSITGTVLDCGDGRSRAMSVFEGFPVPESAVSDSPGGRDLTFLLKSLLEERRFSLSNQIASLVKEEFCYVAADFEQEMANPKEVTFRLPDDRVFTIGTERFRSPEALFRPSHFGFDLHGVHEMINRSILNCDPEMRRALYGNIFLGGGTTACPGIEERLKKEMIALAPPGTEVRIVAQPHRKYAAWVGASFLVTSPVFRYNWITKDQYEESGPAVARDCLI